MFVVVILTDYGTAGKTVSKVLGPFKDRYVAQTVADSFVDGYMKELTNP